MSDDNMDFDFRRGAEEAKAAAKGSNFARTEFFNIDDGKSAILRFISPQEDWIVVDQHAMIPTKGKPSDSPEDRKWPEKMGCVCRNTKMGNGKPMYGDCYICEFLVG